MYPPYSPQASMHSRAGALHEYDAFCCNGPLVVAVLLVQHNRLIQICSSGRFAAIVSLRPLSRFRMTQPG